MISRDMCLLIEVGYRETSATNFYALFTYFLCIRDQEICKKYVIYLLRIDPIARYYKRLEADHTTCKNGFENYDYPKYKYCWYVSKSSSIMVILKACFPRIYWTEQMNIAQVNINIALTLNRHQ